MHDISDVWVELGVLELSLTIIAGKNWYLLKAASSKLYANAHDTAMAKVTNNNEFMISVLGTYSNYKFYKNLRSYIYPASPTNNTRIIKKNEENEHQFI